MGTVNHCPPGHMLSGKCYSQNHTNRPRLGHGCLKKMTTRSECDLGVFWQLRLFNATHEWPLTDLALDCLVCAMFPFTQGFFRGRGVLRNFGFAKTGTLISTSLPQRTVAEQRSMYWRYPHTTDEALNAASLFHHYFCLFSACSLF